MIRAMGRMPRRFTAMAAGMSGLLVLAACTSAVSRAEEEGVSAGGPSVSHGAGAEEWQEAFEEVDGTYEIVWQTASSAATPSGQWTEEFAAQMEEYSGGKVSVEVAFQDAISGTPQEADEAMQDGRIDMHLLVPFQQPSDYPVSGQLLTDTSIMRDTSFIAGYLASVGAINEAAWEIPELHEEFENGGLTVLSPIPTIPSTSLACSEPLTSLDDLRGKQIRVGPSGTYGQIEAMGATPVSVVFADLYESLQRGIIDCLVIGTTTMSNIPGMTELAPYIIHPEGTNFVTTPGIDLAGADWPTFPLVVQQLISDTMAEYMIRSLAATVENGVLQYEQSIAAGGEFLSLDDDANEALASYNEDVIESWRSSELLDDGDAWVDSLEESFEKWDALMVEAGYTDAEVPDVESWKDVELDMEPFAELFYEHVHIPNRPE